MGGRAGGRPKEEGESTLDRPPPDAPTDITPGPGKVAVLARRYRAGRSLWHPGDATFETCPEPVPRPPPRDEAREARGRRGVGVRRHRQGVFEGRYWYRGRYWSVGLYESWEAARRAREDALMEMKAEGLLLVGKVRGRKG